MAILGVLSLGEESRFPDANRFLGRQRFFVIARNSTFTYKGQAVDVRDVSVQLGVQRPENINNLYPSLRLDGKASGQRLTEIGPI